MNTAPPTVPGIPQANSNPVKELFKAALETSFNIAPHSASTISP